MSRFRGRFILEPDHDCRRAILHVVFSYYSDRLGRWIHVPRGFDTDGASVPRIFWVLIPPWGRYGMAAVLHDLLYRLHICTRRQADDVLLEAMWVRGCNLFEYFIIYTAVRLFGRHAWDQDSQKPLPPDQLAHCHLSGLLPAVEVASHQNPAGEDSSETRETSSPNLRSS